MTTLTKNQTDTLLESIEHLKFTDPTSSSSGADQIEIEPETDNETGNVNLGKREVAPS